MNHLLAMVRDSVSVMITASVALMVLKRHWWAEFFYLIMIRLILRLSASSMLLLKLLLLFVLVLDAGLGLRQQILHVSSIH